MRFLRSSLFAAFAAVVAPAQATVIPVTSNSSAALEAAIVAANSLAFQTSAAQPVVIELASNLIGQTIFLTSAMPIIVVDWLTIRVAGASPSSRVVVDATNTSTTLRLTGRHATVRNIRFQNAGPPGSPFDVFTATGADGLLLENCEFDGAGGNALWLHGVVNATVQDCSFRFSAAGFAATGGTSGVTLQRNTFTANQQCMLLAVASQMTIRDSLFDGNGFAMALQPVCSNVTFGPNNVVKNSNLLPAIVSAGAVNLTITGNQFTDNHHAAIQLGDLTAFATITNNVLLRNGINFGTYQVLIDSSRFVHISGLVCRDGGGGVFASSTQQLTLKGLLAAPTAITGNDFEGVVVTACSDVVVDQVTIDDNLENVAGAQLSILGSTRVDVTGSGVTNAIGPSRIGVRIDASHNVRIGQGSVVLENPTGIFVSNSNDLTLGNWTGAGGSLEVRGLQPLQMLDCLRAQVGGIAGAPCTLRAGTTGSSIAVAVTRCHGGRFGPAVLIDGRATTSIAMQVADTNDATAQAVTMLGHTFAGLVGVNSPRLLVRDCVVDGGTNGPQATGVGILLNPGCHAARLFGNLAMRQQDNGFAVVNCDDVLVGPGNRAYDNGGDGFLFNDTGGGAPTRRATIQSSVAVGRNASGQSGLRCVHMLMNVVNVTSTRNGTGILLQLSTAATIVNTISHGNGLDRNRDAGSSGSWLHSLRGTTAGAGWTDQNVLTTNPLFVSAATNDVRLSAGSPAIDSGLHATPAGAGVPCADAALGLRILNATVDRGAHEFVPGAGTGNTLDIAGPWLRGFADGELAFTVRETPGQANQMFLIVMSGSGTGPLVVAPGGTPVPIVPDGLTGILLGAPAFSTGVLNGSGIGTVTLPIPASVTPLLPELTFVAVVSSLATPTNPVVVRFLP